MESCGEIFQPLLGTRTHTHTPTHRQRLLPQPRAPSAAGALGLLVDFHIIDLIPHAQEILCLGLSLGIEGAHKINQLPCA